MTIIYSLIHTVIDLSDVYIYMSAKENTTKFNNTNTNFNERTNNTLNQQQDAINKTPDNTLNNVKITFRRYTDVEKFCF